MHKELGTDRDMIEVSLKQYADPPRHGSWEESGTLTPLEKTNMLELTRDVLCKYMDNRTPQTSQQSPIPIGGTFLIGMVFGTLLPYPPQQPKW